MSKYISKLDVIEFDKMVKVAYAADPGLRKTVRVKSDVQAESTRFQKMSQGLATKKVPRADLTLMNIDYSTVSCPMTDWVAPEISDLFEQQKVNFQEKKELAGVCASAIRRREDQIIIDAVNGATGAHTVPAGTGTEVFLTTAKFRAAKKYMDYYNIPKADRHFLTSVEGLSNLLGDSDADTVDKNAIKILIEGEIYRWLGFNIQDIGHMEEGGIPDDGLSPTLTYTSLVYQKSNVCLATGVNMRTEINYLPMKTSWLVNTLYSGGAITLEDNAIVKVLHEEVVA